MESLETKQLASTEKSPSHVNLDDITICHYCDTMLELPKLSQREASICPHCESVIEKYKPQSLSKYLAWILAAWCLIAVTIFLPFISLDVKGITKVISLPSLFLGFWIHQSYFLSILIAFVLFAAPMLQLLSLLIVMFSIKTNSALFVPKSWMKVASTFKSWNMIDVYLMGVIVTYIKLVDMGDIVFLPAFYTYVMWVFMNIYINTIIDEKWLWKQLKQIN